MFSFCYIVLVVPIITSRYDLGTLTACHLLFLRCLMHVKLNVIKLFNRMSLTTNQNEMMSPDTSDSSNLSSFDVKANNIRNSLSETPAASPRNNQKFIISSNYPIHEDDLSRIDVKSLVRTGHSLISQYFSSYTLLSIFLIYCFLIEFPSSQ